MAVPPLRTRISAAAPRAGFARNARITVRAAALKREHQLGSRHRFAACKIGGRQHVADRFKARRDRFAGPAHILDRHGAECVALGHAVGFLPATDLEHLASETHHQHASHVGIGGVTPLGALQDVIALTLVVHGAPGAVDERDDTVDIGIFVEQAGAFDFACNETGHCRRTIHAGENGEIIACANLAVCPPESLEGCLFSHRQHALGSRLLGMAVIAGKIMQHDVVFMQPFAGRDRMSGKADRLSELEYRLALRERGDCHLVAAGYACERRHALCHHPDIDGIDGDDKVVTFMEANDAGLRSRFIEHDRPLWSYGFRR